MLNILYVLPKSILSYLFGLLAVIPIPMPLRESFYGWYAQRYGVAVEEASRPLHEYKSLQDFFTRDLKEGIRPVGEGLVSPVDGRVVQVGTLSSGELLQAKGKSYTLADLLQSKDLEKKFIGGSYATIYLAPGDYHHIHSPINGMIKASLYVPGELWPVNDWSVERIERLFTRNERITTYIESSPGSVALVKVGATNVGSIRTEYNDFRGNPFSHLWGVAPTVVHQQFEPKIEVMKGQRVGSFYLGSTVILLSEQLGLEQLSLGRVKMGQSLLAQEVSLSGTANG